MNDPENLNDLRCRHAPAEITPERFKEIGYRLVDEIANHLAELPSLRVTPGEAPAEVREALRAETTLPDTGADPAALLGEATRLLFDHSLFNGHPRFFGYITSSAAPIGVFGDFLAAAVNPNAGAWKLSPAATELEAQTIRWIAELIGYPPGGGGLLVSGGNMANFVGFLAARAAKAGWDVRREGVAAPGGGCSLRVYASSGTHTWIEKAVDLFGLGSSALRWIPVDGLQRLDLEALRRQVSEDRVSGLRPFLVVGTAGSVGTGAVDPLADIAAFCREQDLWFHVDGAYGAVAAGVPGAPADLAGLREADSVAIDPHKWLYAPLEAGCALVRDPGVLRSTFSYSPPYYHFDPSTINYYDLGLQNSRGFRALKVWLALRQAGRSGYHRMIADDIRLARHLYRLAARHPSLEALTHNLSITTFRFVPPALRSGLGSPAVEAGLNRLNQELLTALERSGAAFLSNAVLDGKYALRACVVNFRTSLSDIESLPELVAGLGRQVHARLGAGPGGQQP